MKQLSLVPGLPNPCLRLGLSISFGFRREEPPQGFECHLSEGHFLDQLQWTQQLWGGKQHPPVLVELLTLILLKTQISPHLNTTESIFHQFRVEPDGLCASDTEENPNFVFFFGLYLKKILHCHQCRKATRRMNRHIFCFRPPRFVFFHGECSAFGRQPRVFP